MKPIGQDSSLNISLPMIFQIIAVISAFVWGYGELNGRISFLEYQVKMNEEHITDIEEDAEANQNAEIPADIKQNQRLYYLEKELERRENRSIH